MAPAGSSADYVLPPLTRREFARVQQLVRREAGINLADSKHSLVISRLGRRLRELALPSFNQYFELVASDPGELIRLLDAIATNETQFFREPRQFALLEEEVLPTLAQRALTGARPRRLRIWSAACSSGEEPFSIAMSVLATLPQPEQWDIRILATDISTRMLGRAEAATWPMTRAQQIRPAYLRAYMLRGTGPEENRMRAAPSLRALIRFARLNFNDPEWSIEEPFDLIFCRNAMIYFDQALRDQTTRRLLDLLVPDGLLFLGHAEGLHRMQHEVRMEIPSVYRKAPALPRRRTVEAR